MQAQSGQMTGPALQALLEDGTLTGHWVLDPHTSTVRLKTKAMGPIRVSGPNITFTVYGIRLLPQDVGVTGALTVRDRTRPLSFNAVASSPSNGEVWLDAEISINRDDFGIGWSFDGLASATSTLTIHAVFIRR